LPTGKTTLAPQAMSGIGRIHGVNQYPFLKITLLTAYIAVQELPLLFALLLLLESLTQA
jgi:hypothetical protein